MQVQRAVNQAEGQPVQKEAERMLWEKFRQGWKVVEHPVFNLDLHCAKYIEN